MSFKTGKQITCDCCGDKVFVDRIHLRAPGDKEYHDPPDGWVEKTSLGDLCGRCHEKLRRAITNVFGYDRAPDEWRIL